MPPWQLLALLVAVVFCSQTHHHGTMPPRPRRSATTIRKATDVSSESSDSSADIDGPEVRKKLAEIEAKKAKEVAKKAAAEKKKAVAEKKKKAAEKKKKAAETKKRATPAPAPPAKRKKNKNEENDSSSSDSEDIIAAAAAAAADRNSKRPKGADAGHVAADKEKKKPKADKKFDWRNSAAKKYLKKCFKDGVIPLTYPTDDGGSGPQAVWDEHCKDHPFFKGMVYDTNFTNRLRTVKNDSIKKMKRAEVDKKNLAAFRAKHPIDPMNARGLGELRWEGSVAEKFLKEDIDQILKMDDEAEIGKRLKPSVFHASRPEFSVFQLKTFRDHIYQEKRTRKFLSYSEAEKNKPSKNKVIE